MNAMHFHRPNADLHIPDQTPADRALARTTHLGIGAHQDDLEIMAIHGILACYRAPSRWFTGVVVTDGAGSPRSGRYARYSDARMAETRRREQREAATIGDYAAMVQLDYPSAIVKSADAPGPVEDLVNLLEACAPEVVYTHNLADKHDTHVAVALRVVSALRTIPKRLRPKKVYGVEVWRDLDWMVDDDKVPLDLSGADHVQAALIGVFDSQIAGGKRYDLAAAGRRRAHATYHASHGIDAASGLGFAMDLTPLMNQPNLDPLAHTEAHIARFAEDVRARFRRVRGA
jgi:LmbE family N-acetylglucosaminyl deacetylase